MSACFQQKSQPLFFETNRSYVNSLNETVSITKLIEHFLRAGQNSGLEKEKVLTAQERESDQTSDLIFAEQEKGVLEKFNTLLDKIVDQ